ncbi:MAG TPA: tetratricopeptide repeat protein [Vicinamibacterales bacterium]|nr:tetratricopeptide repeat protein [Vicinamibacterales bacterium]
MSVADLEQRALALMKAADFGDEAVRVNEAIIAAAPQHAAAWTRLGRCRLEQRQFDAAADALRGALAINPSSTIAANLLAECRRRRALTPTAAERATSGFTVREFAQIESFGDAETAAAVSARVEPLLDAINGTSVAETILQARRRRGAAASSRLFHAGGVHAGGPGHIYVFHHGGRWEPQFNLGWFAPPSMAACMRIGVGFNTSTAGRDPDRERGQSQILECFARFQHTLATAWRTELARWMAGAGGFLQHGAAPPALDLDPVKAVDWLLSCRHPADIGWIFVGRWLFLDRIDDAAILRDRAKLARAVDETLRALLPIWRATYDPPAP